MKIETVAVIRVACIATSALIATLVAIESCEESMLTSIAVALLLLESAPCLMEFFLTIAALLAAIGPLEFEVK